jgi:hypothetical protein
VVINYQGQLTNASNAALANTTTSLAFRIYTQATGGQYDWSETHSTVQTDHDGRFNVMLNSTGGASGDLANLLRTSGPLWLEVQVNNETLAPRQPITSAGYALTVPWSGLSGIPAGFADGTDDGGMAGTGLSLNNGFFEIETPYRLPQTCTNGQIAEWNYSSQVWQCGDDASASYSAGDGLTLSGTEFSVNFSGSGSATTASRSDHTHTNQSWTTASNVGLQITSSSGVAGASAFYGKATGANDVAGVMGETTSTSQDASGVYGHASATSGQTVGVYGKNASINNDAKGVYGYATASSGQTYGVYGQSASSTNGATGVYGYASASSGQTYGVYGQTNSANGYGVYGQATAANAYGVYGSNTAGVGVYGESTLSPGGHFSSTQNYALMADGPALLGGRNPQQIAMLQWYEASQTSETIETEDGPSALAFDGDHIWVSQYNHDYLLKIRASDGYEEASFSAYGMSLPVDLVFDGLRVWALCSPAGLPELTGRDARDGTHAGIGELDSSRRITGTVGYDLLYDGLYLWAATDTHLNRVRITDSGPLTWQRDAYNIQARALAFDGTYIWAASASGNNLIKLTRHGVPMGTYAVGNSPKALVFDGVNIWIANGNGTVTKVRAADGVALGTYTVGSQPRAMVFDGFHIWVVNEGDDTVTKLRAWDGVVVGTFPTGNSPRAIVFDGAHVWVANYDDDTLSKY